MLEGNGLAAIRAERIVLRGISFQLPPGGALLLHGPNGAGKSTLLRLLAGLRPPDAGTLHWNGTNALADPTAQASRVAYLGHRDAIKPGLSVLENLRFLPYSPPRSRIWTALTAMRLDPLAEMPARMLSAGQRRRLAMARVLLTPRPIWLLDEPSLGLDVASLAALGESMAEQREMGGVVVAATHLPLPLPDATVLQLT